MLPASEMKKTAKAAAMSEFMQVKASVERAVKNAAEGGRTWLTYHWTHPAEHLGTIDSILRDAGYQTTWSEKANELLIAWS